MGKLVSGRDPTQMPWKDLGVEVIIESTGAINSLEGGSKHLEAGAKKVVLTAPGKNCPTYVVGVNEGDYDPENDTVVSNASCTTNGMASVCKVLDESFGVQYGMMTTTHSYTGDQMILDGRHRDLRRSRAHAQRVHCRPRRACGQVVHRGGRQRRHQGGGGWPDEGHHQVRGGAAGVQRFHADRLLQQRRRGAHDGHGRGLGEG